MKHPPRQAINYIGENNHANCSPRQSSKEKSTFMEHPKRSNYTLLLPKHFIIIFAGEKIHDLIPQARKRQQTNILLCGMKHKILQRIGNTFRNNR